MNLSFCRAFGVSKMKPVIFQFSKHCYRYKFSTVGQGLAGNRFIIDQSKSLLVSRFSSFPLNIIPLQIIAHKNIRNTSSDTKSTELPPSKNKTSGKGKGPITWRTLGITFGIGGVFLLGMLYVKKLKQNELEKERKRAVGKAKIGGPFNLIDHNGKPCTNKDFLGRWVLLYFGFTHCPDICPDEIEKMIKTVDILEKNKVTQAQPLFITVDPDRDDAKAVGMYVKDFSPKLLGLTGTKDQINEVSRNYRVYHSAGPKDKDADYIVDHTIIIYVIDPSGQFVDYYGQNKTAEEIASGITMYVAKYESANFAWF